MNVIFESMSFLVFSERFFGLLPGFMLINERGRRFFKLKLSYGLPCPHIK